MSSKLCFSPTSKELLQVEQTVLTLDFSNDSRAAIYEFNKKFELSKKAERSFPSSFLCCDWDFQDHIGAGCEGGQVLLCKKDDFETAELLSVTESDITVLRFSDESENCVAVGTEDGQVLFLNMSGQVLFKAQTR